MRTNSMFANQEVEAAVDLLNEAVVKIRKYCPTHSPENIEEGLKDAFEKLNLSGEIISLEALLTLYPGALLDVLVNRLSKLLHELEAREDRSSDWALARELEYRFRTHQLIEGDFDRAEQLLKKYEH